MATTYKTPGVYVEEIPKLPPSVAQVETAIPAFVGYTEKAEKNGDQITNIPTKIISLLEFTTYFGGQREIDTDSITVVTDEDSNYSVQKVTVTNGKKFYLYNSMRLFYDNGGGECYIVSVGGYKTGLGDNTVSAATLTTGVQALEKVDEPTILLFPDAGLIQSTVEDQFYSLQQTALSQCAKLQDRVAVLDLHEISENPWPAPVTKFRDKIGINNLKYSAAYTPWLYNTYDITLPFLSFKNGVKKKDGTTAVTLASLTTDSDLNKLVTDVDASLTDVTLAQSTIDAIRDAGNDGIIPAVAAVPFEAATIKDRYKQLVERMRTAAVADVDDRFRDLLAFVRNTALRYTTVVFTSTSLQNDLTSYAGSTSLWRGGVDALIKIEKNADVLSLTGVANDGAVDALYGASPVITLWLGLAVSATGNAGGNLKNYNNNPPGPALTGLNLANAIEPDIKAALDKLSAFADTMLEASKNYQKAAQDALYERHSIISKIVKSIKKELSKTPPSGAIAGIYARVDNARGVWKAPANESLNSVSGPVVQITSEEQAGLNVDAVAGKSINAIRTFTGKGTLVWGARTLAGNDNEWRYMSVRRFFNMVEESCKKSTEPFVFESNDMNTWVKVQGMIENFLTTLWRQGALQGAKPEHAFYVAVGLGKTMTALDILEGRMIVEIGMAVVRPAEYIILRFSHKMAES